MSASISALIPELQPFARNLLIIAGRAGLQPRLTSTRRSHAEQTRLYNRYLAGQNPYPVAPPGTSAHEYGFAFDLMIEDTPGQMEIDLADLGQVWESWGGIWGGHFKDPIHFEYPGFQQHVVDTAKDVAEPSWRAKTANIAAGFLPGPAGIVAGVGAAIDPHPIFEDDPVPWWKDPQGYLHGLKCVFTRGPWSNAC